MNYISTRDRSLHISAAEAIACGLSRDGGLFVPEQIPSIDAETIAALCSMNYQQRAVSIMKLFLADYTEEELKVFTSKAYSMPGFDTPAVAPVQSLDEKTHFLELWHGPTSAFKDMALQMLPYFLTSALTKTGEARKVCILVATSGDTGKAALEGFCDVDRTRIMVFYPKDGVSDVQKLQMTSQRGANVGVSAVVGNFDDAQSGVKTIFSDPALREALSAKGWFLSSANSINWGRLLPQIVYYISAYCDLVNRGAIQNGDKIHFCVPTGNFGNILAGYYAKRMGLPVEKLICASNQNDVLTEFIQTGVYNKNRPFYTTISPSMDILVSSNLERLLFELSGKDDKLVADYMQQLSGTGSYQVSDAMRQGIQEIFVSGCCSDAETKAMIAETFAQYGYLIDTHTGVAAHVLQQYRKETGDETATVVVSTASPYKFCSAVLSALGDTAGVTGLDQIDRLMEVTGTKAPEPLTALRHKTERFTGAVEKEMMKAVVEQFLSE